MFKKELKKQIDKLSNKVDFLEEEIEKCGEEKEDLLKNISILESELKCNNNILAELHRNIAELNSKLRKETKADILYNMFEMLGIVNDYNPNMRTTKDFLEMHKKLREGLRHE